MRQKILHQDHNKDHHGDSDQKLHAHSFDQDAENMVKKVKQALANGEGCRVYGVLDVQRVAGNFHISVHGLNIFVAQMVSHFGHLFDLPTIVDRLLVLWLMEIEVKLPRLKAWRYPFRDLKVGYLREDYQHPEVWVSMEGPKGLTMEEGQFDGVINWTATPMKDDSKKGVIESTPALSDRQLSMSFRNSSIMYVSIEATYTSVHPLCDAPSVLEDRFNDFMLLHKGRTANWCWLHRCSPVRMESLSGDVGERPAIFLFFPYWVLNLEFLVFSFQHFLLKAGIKGLHNPLDGTVRILRGASGTFKYYIKIVPTEYRYISKEVLPTNQFSVMEYFSPMNEFDRTWPAVYFLYDLSPVTVTIKEERRSFLHFITRLCAVLGGTFALTGMLDRWMYRFLEMLTKPNAKSVYR
ncbi:Endoplasmic reticulum-Golgi intermediate compartment protein 3 [Vitis vinifera]|uniref:Endoplasmic reticulum-Golgi intermediate compartment protein 3 n=1 Tax=Vitis vinifera TaxID=29760 RepID=A0A438IPB0_VITVI|nr:Endoplasmic reticulum-Golgi intermediate compartment protein 3 [Vitis vinifera]